MEQTSLEELKRTAASGAYRRIPIWREIFSDIATPVQVLKKLLAVSDHCFLLESAEDNKQWGRYSFLGFDPAMELTCMNHQVTITTDHVEQFETENPAQVIARVIEENRAPQIKKLPPLTGGLVGYFAYDYIKYAEPTLRLDAEDQEKFRDVDLMLFDKMIAFDHYRQKIILICNSRISEADVQAEGGQTAGAAAATDLRARGKSARAAADAPVSAAEPDTLEAVYRTALQTLDQMQDIIEKGAEKNVSAGRLTTELTPLFDQESYCEKVEQVKQYIHEGDIFQLVLSNRLEAGFDGSLLDTYRILRTKNPSPYMFYFSSDDLEIAGASPETLVKVDNQTAYTFPLAGTRPRGKDEKEDQELEADLLSDEKELAEHNMLVDLGRNDLGRFCRFGTVEVEKYLSVEKFSHVMHLGSTVRGELRSDKTALDALQSVLPAGTLSGAPKLRACQIINDLENNKRGIYGGAIGYLDFTGNLDTCIAIRIAFSKNGKVFVRSGAGIVADSVPEKEYQECINKAAAVTEEVSLTAVPAKRPKPSLERPSTPPRVGKIRAAMTLNRKMTEMAWAISSSSAPITGAVAAMAEPPQMEDPTPTSTEILLGIFIHLRSRNAITRDMVMVVQIMGRDWAPTLAISERFRPKPRRITAYCRIFLEVKAMPA